MTSRLQTLKQRATSERALGPWLAIFIIVQALSVAGVTLALVYEGRTADRVEVLEREPTPAEIRARVRSAINALTEREARALLATLIAKATPRQRAELAGIVRELDRQRRRDRARDRQPRDAGASRRPPRSRAAPAPSGQPGGSATPAPTPPPSTGGAPKPSSPSSTPSTPPPPAPDRPTAHVPDVTITTPDVLGVPVPDVTITTPDVP